LLVGRLTLAAVIRADPATLALLADPRRKRKRQMEFPWKGLT